MTLYRLILSDGKKVSMMGSSASAAIEAALWTFRGRTVKSCYSGVKADDVDAIRALDRTAKPIVGWIDHEVPRHDPIDAGATKATRRGEDGTISMFDEAQIEHESHKAKLKFEN